MSFPTIQRRHAIATIIVGVVQLANLLRQEMPVNVLTKDFIPAKEVRRDVAMHLRNTAKGQILPFNHASKVAAIAVVTRL